MYGTVGNANKSGDVAVQVEQRMHLNSGLVLPEFGPREQRKTQIDGGRIQSIQTLVEFHADRIMSVERSAMRIRTCAKSAKSLQSALVGIRQRGACDLATEARAAELAATDRRHASMSRRLSR